MRPNHRVRFLLAGSLLVILAACGGGGDHAGTTTPTSGGTAASPNDPAKQAAFATDYGSGLAALKTYGGLTSTTFLDNFDDAFVDGGYTKAQVRDALTQEAAAQLLFSTDLSSFPAAKLSAITINGCDANNVCTLTATLTNTDVDTTSVTFSTRLSFTGGKFRLLGDQKQA